MKIQIERISDKMVLIKSEYTQYIVPLNCIVSIKVAVTHPGNIDFKKKSTIIISTKNDIYISGDVEYIQSAFDFIVDAISGMDSGIYDKQESIIIDYDKIM